MVLRGFTFECDIDIDDDDRDAGIEEEIGGARRWICEDCYELNRVKTVNAEVLQQRIDKLGDGSDIGSKEQRARFKFHLWIYRKVFENQRVMFWNDALGQLRIFYQSEGLPFRNVHNTWER